MRGILSILLLCLLASNTPAEDPPPAPATSRQVADRVLAACAAGDEPALEALAQKDTPDPWLVGEDLVSRGRFDEALRFAKAAPREDTRALPAYIEKQRGRKSPAAARKAIAEARAAREKGRPDEVLRILSKVDTGTEHVISVQVLELRAAAHGHRNDVPACAKTWREAGEKAESIGWLAVAAADLNRAAQALCYIGRYREVLEVWERTLAIHKKRGRRRDIAAILGNLAVVHQNLGNLSRCVELSGRALEIAEEIGADGIVLNALTSRGIAERMMGNPRRALTAYERCMKIAERTGDRAAQARTLTNRGLALFDLARYEEAIAAFEASRSLNEELGILHMAAGALMNLGLVHERRGDWIAALRAYEGARERAIRIGYLPLLGAADCNIGNLLSMLGDSAGALAAYEKALTAVRKSGDRVLEARVRGNIGFVHSALGEWAKALEMLEEVLEISTELGDGELRGNTLANMGNACRELGRLEEAEARISEALEIATGNDNRDRVVRATNGLGLVAMARKDPAAAEARFRSALSSAREIASLDLELAVRSNLTRVLARRGRNAEAVAVAREAAGILTLLIRGQADDLGTTGRERWRELYESGVLAAHAAGDIESVSFFLEAGRAGALMETLGGREALRRALVPERLRALAEEARRAERDALANFRRALADGRRREIAAARGKLEEARQRVTAAVRRVQREAKVAAVAVYPKPDSLKAVRDRIGPAQALVLFALLEEKALALVSTRKSSRVVELGEPDSLRAAIEDFSKPGRDEDWSPPAAALRELAVEPLELGEDVRTVLLSPDGRLGNVPFALLFPGRDVALVPSGTMLGILRDRKVGAGRGTLAVGDPNVPDLAQLPASRAEAKAVGDVVLTGDDATVSALFVRLAARERWRALHFACHGLLDDAIPSRSALALTPAGGSDGRLTCTDLFFRRIPADLVVLSSCDSSRGRVYSTEGIVGLSRAFLMAGVPRVVGTLWKVDDAATSALMVKFHELLKDGGRPTAAALRAAQEFIRSREKWRHPRYWAAWVLWGLPD